MEVATENKTGYKKTKLGWIPDNWEETTLDNTKSNSKWSITGGPFGSNLKVSDYVEEGGIKILQLQDIGDGIFINKSNTRTSVEKADELLSCNIYPGDIIISKMGDPVARACIISNDEERYVMASDGIRLNLNSDEWEIKYVLNLINSAIVRNIAKRWSIGSTRQRIGLSDLKKLPVVKPDIQEQKVIASCLSTWDNAILNLTELIEQKKNQKKGFMQQLLTGKKRLSGFIGEWETDKLGKYFEERKETGYDNLELLSIGEKGVYPQANSNKKNTSNKDKSKYKRICIDDIGYNTMRMWQGRSALSKLEGIVSPAYTIVKPLENADSTFFGYLFKLEEMIHKFYRNSQGMVSDTLMCKYKDFKIVKFQSPPNKEEQTAIAKVLRKADEEIEVLNKKLDLLKEQKKGLMQQLLTGKKRLKF